MLWEFNKLMTGRVRRRSPLKTVFSLASLLACLCLVLGMGRDATAQEAPAFPRGDGQVRIFNYHLNEFIEVRFRQGNDFIPAGLDQVNALLRSRDNSEQAPIDPRLLDLIDHLQDHYEADTIEIISGYRRKEFNDSLLKTGHTVSPVSLHTKGQAIDIHIDEIREETLRDYLLSLKLGGVGYYGPLDFVHIDVGPVRRWGEPMGSGRKLVGVLQPEAPIQLTSDKNDYLPGETLFFTWTSLQGFSQSSIQALQLEHFHRGKWESCPTSGPPAKDFSLPATNLSCEPGQKGASFGKFRWTFKIPGNESPLSSNEFYLKKS